MHTPRLTFTILPAVMIACLLGLPSGAQCGILPFYGTAERASFTGRVTITDHGPALETGVVEQSTGVGGGAYVPTGYVIQIDESGDGSVVIPNTASGCLLCGHLVRVVFPTKTLGPMEVINVSGWFASYAPCPDYEQEVLVSVDQYVENEGNVLLETWDDGALWILRLDSDEATWVTIDTPTIGSSEGDLSAGIASITSTDITIEITHDPSPTTPNSIVISGVGIKVASAGSSELHCEIGIQGTVSTYYNGVLDTTQTFVTPTFVAATTIEANLTGVQETEIPTPIKLWQNVPNPFADKTEIAFDLSEAHPVRLDIFTVDGRHVATLVNEQMPAGWHRVAWNGRDNTGRNLASGIYFCRLAVGPKTETRRMILSR